MIRRFRHRGIQQLYEKDRATRLNPQHAAKLRRILARLDVASQPDDVDLPGWRLHPLKGKYSGFWSITVQANWRIIFRFVDGDVTDVDYLDYH